ncbi:GAD-like domain-containing protein [Rhizobium helianthi]|uniref:GAD-like domain-containing protein n=1 Tax=Rhizobium helianthi TaxID=1132695 RepID=A0ABW4LYC4_9HYPH
MPISDDFVALFNEIGKPTGNSAMTHEELLILNDIFPKFMVDFYKEYGRCIMLDGHIQLCHPRDLSGVISLIFGADPVFNHNEFHAFSYSAFGTINIWNKELGCCWVYLLEGEVTCRALTKPDKLTKNLENTIYTPFEISKELYDVYDINKKPLFQRAVKKCGPLEIGECYGFVPALGLGGVADIDHVKRMDAAAHFSIVAQTMNFNLIDVQGYGKSVIVRPIG